MRISSKRGTRDYFVAAISFLLYSAATVCWHFKAISIYEDRGTKIRDSVEVWVYMLFRNDALKRKSAYCLGVSQPQMSRV